MTKQELLFKLEEINKIKDIEARHYEADKALIEYIDDKEISKIYFAVDKWYA